MLPWQTFLAFYICGAHWRHPANTTEPSVCDGDVALYQITLTTVYKLTGTVWRVKTAVKSQPTNHLWKNCCKWLSFKQQYLEINPTIHPSNSCASCIQIHNEMYSISAETYALPIHPISSLSSQLLQYCWGMKNEQYFLLSCRIKLHNLKTIKQRNALCKQLVYYSMVCRMTYRLC